MSPGETLGRGVLVYPECLGNLPMGKAIPGTQAQQLTVSFSKRIEGTAERILFLPANDRHVGPVPGFRGQAAQASRKSPPPGLSSVLVAHYSTRHRQQPGLGHIGVGDLIEAAPSNREHLGGRVLGVGSVDSANAISINIGVMPLEEVIEAQLGIRSDGYDIP